MNYTSNMLLRMDFAPLEGRKEPFPFVTLARRGSPLAQPGHTCPDGRWSERCYYLSPNAQQAEKLGRFGEDHPVFLFRIIETCLCRKLFCQLVDIRLVTIKRR